jgi:Ca2+-binding EF-hand superfamily protein
MGLKNELTLPNFEKFITNICKDVSKSEIRYIFDKLDTNSRGTISTK